MHKLRVPRLGGLGQGALGVLRLGGLGGCGMSRGDSGVAGCQGALGGCGMSRQRGAECSGCPD